MARMVQKRESCKLTAIRPEPKRLIVKSSELCEDNIKKSFQMLDRGDRAGLIWLIIGEMEVCCGHGNELFFP